MLLSVLLACGSTSTEPPDQGFAECGVAEASEAPKTVLLFTVDTVNEAWLRDATYPAAPAHQRIFDEGVVLANTICTRGVTIESLPTIATGTYRRTHGVGGTDLPEHMPPMVQEYYQGAGYRTLGYSSNFCDVIEQRGWDRFECTGPGRTEGSDLERDSALIESALEEIAAAGDQDLFLWIHLRDPHVTYSARSPWIDDFWGDRPRLGPITSSQVSAYMLGKEEEPEGFDEWLEVVYATQIASTDAMLLELIDALEAVGRWDDAIVVTGTDHGEELGAHHGYYLHGCSPYGSVLDTTFGVRAPTLGPAVVETPVSTADVLPTLLCLSGLEPDAAVEGHNLGPLMRGETTERGPVFFEREAAAAGVYVDGRKYFMQGDDTPFRGCVPYNLEGEYPGPIEALWDLSVDPGEETNLIGSQDVSAERSLICEWVTEKTWTTEERDEQNPLVQTCREHLAR